MHLLVHVAGVTRFVGRLDVNDEQVRAVGQRVERALALRGVVGVVSGGHALDVEDLDAREHTEAPYQVDGTVQRGVEPVLRREGRHRRLRALPPEPHLVGGEAESADDLAGRVHQLAQARGRRARSATRPAFR